MVLPPKTLCSGDATEPPVVDLACPGVRCGRGVATVRRVIEIPAPRIVDDETVGGVTGAVVADALDGLAAAGPFPCEVNAACVSLPVGLASLIVTLAPASWVPAIAETAAVPLGSTPAPALTEMGPAPWPPLVLTLVPVFTETPELP